MIRRLAVLAATVVAAFGAATAVPARPLAAPVAVAKICRSGYVHAFIAGAHKCLRAGEFCTRAYDAQYRRYGFRCIRYYANVSRYRLTYA